MMIQLVLPLLLARFFIFYILFLPCEDVKSQEAGNRNSDVILADPTIFLHKGVYYLYGTVDQHANNGFTVYTSTDLEHWEGPKGTTSEPQGIESKWNRAWGFHRR